jgi:hypothetical protein
MITILETVQNFEIIPGKFNAVRVSNSGNVSKNYVTITLQFRLGSSVSEMTSCGLDDGDSNPGRGWNFSVRDITAWRVRRLRMEESCECIE